MRSARKTMLLAVPCMLRKETVQARAMADVGMNRPGMEIMKRVVAASPQAAVTAAVHMGADIVEGAGLTGQLAYRFVPEDGGTGLIHQETVETQGLLRLLEPDIRPVLESGWEVADHA